MAPKVGAEVPVVGTGFPLPGYTAGSKIRGAVALKSSNDAGREAVTSAAALEELRAFEPEFYTPALPVAAKRF